MKFVAFLRGINVGGVTVKMEDLKALLEKCGFTQVQTVIASGNVIFEAAKGDADSITRKIEAALKKKYKRDIAVMVRTLDELKKMERSDPFKGIKTTPKTRLYVTFMYEPSRGVAIPKPESSFRIVGIRGMDAFSVIELSEEKGTVDAMAALAKIFGARITMRNWNTVKRILKAAAEPTI